MLKNINGKLLHTYQPDYVIFDLETTGISWKKDAIIEISAIRVRGGKNVAEFSQLVNPQRPIPYHASMVNHIYDKMVTNKPTIEEIMPEFIDFIGDDLLVGHNIHMFDMKFIYKDCRTVFGLIPDNDYADTLFLARSCFPEMSHHRLSDLAERFNLSTENAHRALEDCKTNMIVYEEIGKVMKL